MGRKVTWEIQDHQGMAPAVLWANQDLLVFLGIRDFRALLVPVENLDLLDGMERKVSSLLTVSTFSSVSCLLV